MKVVQIIDSLDAGGAERMALNYANCLKDEIEFSGLVVTRDEGVLKNQIEPDVHFLNLKRKGTFDFKAILKLRKFLSENKIEVIHTHGSSFFIGVLVKLIYFRIKLIWHDHYGDRVKDSLSNNLYIKTASIFFNGVIACNNELLQWAKKNLFGSNHVYLPNFTVNNLSHERKVVLKGIEGKRIVCLSNLRNPKNHMVLLEGFYKSGVSEKGWTLHLIGKDNNDPYSENIKEFIRNNNLENEVFLYGAQNDVYSVLSQTTIGVLASTFEGFPVVLLEYGQSGLAVISSNVGQCPEIILDGKNGLLFQPHDASQLAVELQKLTEDEALRVFYSSNLKSYVYQNFSGEAIIQKAIHFYKSV
ncbi:glycosyltransferase [Flavobacterium amniphilum]|uniref:glycosyltransferase n=1 Tax=Flavobacterium amniphilum TaxID=1834035 RepID=UPI00202A80E8|nr:glycosyltransferase [Flavobacterium amniphilum]MCL9805093.1 glycosyltransferase [Flavobacterium amniphilum]